MTAAKKFRVDADFRPRLSEVRAANDPSLPPSLPFRVNTLAAHGLNIAATQSFNKVETEYGDMRDELWLVFDLLQENPLWRQGFLTRLKCPASVVYNKGWGSEVAQLGSAGRNVSAP